jgi:uncharacterized membrane protein YkoI
MWRLAAAVVLALLPGVLLAVPPEEIYSQLDTCLDAAKKQQDGQLTRWELVGKQAPYAFDVEMVAPDDRVWKMRCEDGKVSNVERRTGVKNYKKLVAGNKVPEVSARYTAVGAFQVSELRKMEYGLSWRGRAYYSYEMSLNDGRDASVDVNAESGQIDRSHSERKS